MTAVKATCCQTEYSDNSESKKRNRSDNKKLLNRTYRAGTLSERTCITVENRYSQPCKMIRTDKGNVKNKHTGDLPPNSSNFSSYHGLFYPDAWQAKNGGIWNNIPHFFPHNSYGYKNYKQNKEWNSYCQFLFYIYHGLKFCLWFWFYIFH